MYGVLQIQLRESLNQDCMCAVLRYSCQMPFNLGPVPSQSHVYHSATVGLGDAVPVATHGN